MKRQAILGIAVIALLGVPAQRRLPPLLTGHVEALQDAASIRITFTVREGFTAPEDYTLVYSKPNLFRIESPKGFTLSDGKNIYIYLKEPNTFTVSDATPEAMAKQFGAEEVWAWSAFFDKDALKAFSSAKAGSKRSIKGNATTEIIVTLAGAREGTASLFIDNKLKIARGFVSKTADKNLINPADKDLQVIATEIKLSADAISSSEFIFTAPEGAKEAEEVKPGASFADVQALLSRNCMPCHNRQTRSGGFEYTTYQGIVSAVEPGDPDRSAIINAVSGPNPRMPQMRRPLTEEQVSLLTEWIAAGAKRE